MAAIRPPQILTVGPEAEGQRLDNFLLRRMKSAPRSLVYRLVRKGAVRVNGRRSRVDLRLAQGDQVRFPAIETTLQPAADRDPISSALSQRLQKAIIEEDADFLVLDKPAGLAVHGGTGLAHGLIESLRQLRPGVPLELGHRLDRETSGCLVLAKSRRALQALHAAFREGRVEKRYLALLVGDLGPEPRECHLPIARETPQPVRRRMQAHPEGAERTQAASSRFEPLERFANYTLAGVAIGTGRTHQIRVHAQALGHPVVGDAVYGEHAVNRQARRQGLRRQFLHAQSLRFSDWQGEHRVYSADLPQELMHFLTTVKG